MAVLDLDGGGGVQQRWCSGDGLGGWEEGEGKEGGVRMSFLTIKVPIANGIGVSIVKMSP